MLICNCSGQLQVSWVLERSGMPGSTDEVHLRSAPALALLFPLDTTTTSCAVEPGLSVAVVCLRNQHSLLLHPSTLLPHFVVWLPSSPAPSCASAAAIGDSKVGQSWANSSHNHRQPPSGQGDQVCLSFRFQNDRKHPNIKTSPALLLRGMPNLFLPSASIGAARACNTHHSV